MERSSPMVERVDGLPQINIEYDRMRLANYGLNIEDVNDMVSVLLLQGNQLELYMRTNGNLI
jgi:Cu/Ag efflux pump CusA